MCNVDMSIDEGFSLEAAPAVPTDSVVEFDPKSDVVG